MKSFKKALAVFLSVLMVAFSFPLSALAVPNPNNQGYWSDDEDVSVSIAVVDYTARNEWGYDSSDLLIMGEGVKSLSRSQLASDDGTFAVVFYVSGLDSMSSYNLTYDVHTEYATNAYIDRRETVTGGAAGTDSVLALYADDFYDGSSSPLDGFTNGNFREQDQIYLGGVLTPQDDPAEETDLSYGDGTMIVPGSVFAVIGMKMADGVDTIDLTKAITPCMNTIEQQICTVYGDMGKNLYLAGSTWTEGYYDENHQLLPEGEPVTEATLYSMPQWGLGVDTPETPTDVTYTYHFANGDTQQVTAAAGEAPVAPENSANSAAVSNNDGTHTYNTYSWPAWVDGTTDYTEVATPVTEACDMQKTADAVAPTHTTAGKTQVDTCSVCGYQTGGVEVPAEGHSWVEESRTPATCVATGEVKYTCSCGETMTETLPIDPENHANVVTDEAVAATCTKTGLTEGSHCAACDTVIVAQTETPIDPSNHTNVVTDAAVAATCTEAGLTEGSHCADCDTVIVAQETIDALGHDYQITASTDATCVTPGSVTYTCTRCGDSYTDEGVLDPTKHEGEIVSADNAVAPTREKDGKEADMICSACHAVVEAGAVIPALGVQITVEPNELGTTTLNGEATTGEAQKVAYKSNYTLAATPNEGAEFVGWQVNGKLVSTDATYTTAAYADLTYVPVFAEKADDFTVTFVDQFNMVLGTYTSSEVAALEAMPSTYNYLGYTFADWSMTLEEVKALDTNAIVTANYTKDSALTYTVSAPGCTITVGGTVYNDTAEVKFDQAVTVAPVDGTATAWTVNGNNAAYGAEYTFYVTSDVNVAYTSDEVTAAPTVAAVDVTAVNDSDVRFLATRNVPADYKLIESGFLYGKDFDNAESDLDLGNANNGECYIIKNSNTANDGQFALTLTVTSQTGVVYARAYVIAADAEGNTAVYYADVQSFDYNA